MKKNKSKIISISVQLSGKAYKNLTKIMVAIKGNIRSNSPEGELIKTQIFLSESDSEKISQFSNMIDIQDLGIETAEYESLAETCEVVNRVNKKSLSSIYLTHRLTSGKISINKDLVNGIKSYSETLELKNPNRITIRRILSYLMHKALSETDLHLV